MNPYDDDFNDPFESIIKEFFGDRVRYNPQRNQVIKGEEEERFIDFVETDDYLYLVFELPGFEKKDINVDVKNNKIEVIAKKRDVETCQNYLCNKLKTGVKIVKKLPDFVNLKNYKKTFKNGVLEVQFLKK